MKKSSPLKKKKPLFFEWKLYFFKESKDLVTSFSTRNLMNKSCYSDYSLYIKHVALKKE